MVGYPLFTLDDDRKIVAASREHWSQWFAKTTNRIIRSSNTRDCRVVTMFLGLNWGSDTDPVFFCTTTYGGRRDGSELRAANYHSAIENHNTALADAKG